ncbi:MAG: hypothetical protein DRG78_05985 [Epsilonproteobacteria bacterium]|nr:MAG: hypothetical protein DRG78_05985 [Campylobacterota bacterium]
MEEYNTAVEFLAQNSINSEFLNKGSKHAAVVIGNMLKNSEQIRLFSGTLDDEVTGIENLKKELENFIKENKKIYLLLESIPKNPSPALKLVMNYANTHPNNAKYKIIEQSFINNLKSNFKLGNALHFAVGDDKSFRVETDMKEYKAICNFNNRVIASKLKNIFDTYFFN